MAYHSQSHLQWMVTPHWQPCVPRKQGTLQWQVEEPTKCHWAPLIHVSWSGLNMVRGPSSLKLLYTFITVIYFWEARSEWSCSTYKTIKKLKGTYGQITAWFLKHEAIEKFACSHSALDTTENTCSFFSVFNTALGLTKDRPEQEFVAGEGEEFNTKERPSHELCEEVSLLEETIDASVRGMY